MKKTIFKKTVLATLVLAITCFACSESFLEEANPTLLSSDSYWKTIDDLNGGLIAVYSSFKDGNVLRTGDEYNRSDMTFPGWGRPNTSNVYWLQTFNNSAGAPNSKWQALYKGIFRANQVISATESLMGSFGSTEAEEQATQILAQARTFRGLFYFYLHSGFNNGAVPIFDFVPQSEEEFYKPISSEDAVQAFYLADLEFGMTNLPVSYPDNQAGRLTAGAAAALLGKSYLYDNDYAMAAQYFKAVIEDYGYTLTPDIGSNFTTRDEFNEESILEIAYSLGFKAEISPYSSEQVSSGLNFAFSPRGGWRSLYPACWLNMEYRNEVLDTKDPRNTVTRIKRQANGLPVLDANGDPEMDIDVPRVFSLRTSASIALPDDLDTQYYGLTSAQGTAYNNSETSYWRKYTNWDITDNEKSISASTPRSGVNVRVIRLADIYLMYAEALIAGGTSEAGLDEALVYVNKVRKRSGVRLLGISGTGEFPLNDHDDVSYTAQTLMEHLMYVERPLELSAEGNAIRSIDLRRWGVTKQRFQELSELRYYSDHYKFETEDGKTGTRWGSLLKNDGAQDANEKFTEFVQAAANYSEALHGYWPIPNSEETANPKLYDSN